MKDLNARKRGAVICALGVVVISAAAIVPHTDSRIGHAVLGFLIGVCLAVSLGLVLKRANP